MMDKLKVAIVGAGYTAREHARVFRDLPHVTLAGIFSRTRVRAESLAAEMGIARVAESVPELYETTGAQLVIVTVPELAMREVSQECFDWPWTVLMEKPPGYDLADALEIEAAAQRAGRDVLVALNRRHLSSTRAVLEDLESDGPRRFITVQDQQDQEAALAVGQPRRVVENWMYANSIHVIDYFSMIGRGEVGSVEHIVRWTPHDPGVVIAFLRFSTGDIGLYEGIWSGPGPWSVSVTTSEQRWEMRPLEDAATQRRGDRTLKPYPKHPWDESFKPGFRAQAEQAVLHASSRPSSSVTLREAIRTMRIVSQIFKEG